MPFRLKGLYTALITPFKNDESLDEKGLRELLKFQIKNRVDGVVLLGTTGEAPTLSENEKERVIQIGVEELKGRTQILIGTGSYSTKQTISQTQKAKELGADGALVITPYYNKPTQEGLYLHFKALTEAVDFPICVYNCAGRTGQNLQTETLKRIASLPNIAGVKEASGQVSQISEVIEKILPGNPDFCVLSGDDALALPLMGLGGHGLISVASNLYPAEVKDMVDACLQGDWKRAKEYHFKLSPFFKAAFLETNPIPIKAAMQMSGKPAGPCRLPLCAMETGNRAKLEEVVRQLTNV